jgi:stage V sporulation protein R
MTLPIELERERVKIIKYAQDFGLDFFPTIFEMVNSDQMSMLAAYGGFPIRYPHWRFGMEYEQLSKSYTYGLSKIYEMVINNNPCYAYLMDCNGIVDQKLVMAHVYGHCDFFKNNYFFSKTNRKMMDQMANHGVKIRRIMEKVGIDKVESFIDVCLSIDNLIDYYSPFIERESSIKYDEDEEHIDPELRVQKLRSKPYMENYINPPEFIEEQKKRILELSKKKKNFPEENEKDILKFLLNYAPLDTWEYEILNIIRDEAYYFAPQGMTKIMNEGWASFWHSKIMTEKALSPNEFIDFADHHSGTVAMHQNRLNPYKVGIELFRNIKERWDKGQFGREYEEISTFDEKKRWNKDLGLGMEKIFEVRKIYNDITFIDEFLTEDFAREHKLFTFGYNDRSKSYEIQSREFSMVKQQLLFQLTNFGNPHISIHDANYKNRAELYLVHDFNGIELQLDYAQSTLESLSRVWKRPVNIETVINDEVRVYTFDGKNHSVESRGKMDKEAS